MRFDGKTVGYTYNPAGLRTLLTYPDGRSVQYQYDGSYKLTGVIDWTGAKTVYSYDQAGNLLSTGLPNGVTSSYGYDADNRLLNITNASRAGALSSFTYTLDSVGNRIRTSGTGGTSTYVYDGLYRLTSWTGPLGQVQYAYDAASNRTSITAAGIPVKYTYDDADELLTAGPLSFTYDGNGSRLSETLLGVKTAYTWDAANRLSAVSTPLTRVQYLYDGDGNRIAQNTTLGNVGYVNDVAGLPEVINEQAANESIDYVQGHALISAIGPQGPDFLDYDGIGSTANVSDARGVRKATYTYDPWGVVVPPVDSFTAAIPYRFAGQALDVASGLYYMRARYYDPATGTFLSRDPLTGSTRWPITMNRYAYAFANPLNYRDVRGLSADQLSGDDTSLQSGSILADVSVDAFGFGSVSVAAPYPGARPAAEGVAVGGYGSNQGAYVSGIGLIGGEIGGLQNFGGVFTGTDYTYSSRGGGSSDSIDIGEAQVGLGLGVGAGAYSTGSGETGVFLYGNINAFGQEISIGIGGSISSTSSNSSGCAITDVCSSVDTQAPITSGDISGWNSGGGVWTDNSGSWF